MRQKEILFILISAFFIVLVWISLNVYHNWVTSTIPEALSIQTTPIGPDFDIKTVENLKKREIIEPVLEIKNNSSESAIPEQNISPSEQASQSGN